MARSSSSPPTISTLPTDWRHESRSSVTGGWCPTSRAVQIFASVIARRWGARDVYQSRRTRAEKGLRHRAEERRDSVHDPLLRGVVRADLRACVRQGGDSY